MFSSFRNRFGIPGVISVIALVFAMFGGAYAASNDSGSATASAKAKKGPRGPRGPQGPAGPQGPKGDTGAAGAAGAKGDAGAKGADGAAGAKGATGATGPTGATGVTGPEGEQGEEGEAGEEGSPWTAGGTLPSGETETGAWAFGLVSNTTSPAAFAAFSFPIPLAEGVLFLAANIHYIAPAGTPPTECPGSAVSPAAEPGHICFYATNVVNAEFAQAIGPAIAIDQPGFGEIGKSGGFLQFGITGAPAFGAGTFAVTAP